MIDSNKSRYGRHYDCSLPYEIRLETEMYRTGKTLTEVLEELDPSNKYHGTALEGLDAFSRQLKRFDIKVSGSQSDIVDKFFKNNQTAILFPEFVRRCVEAGMSENPIVEDIVAVTTNIDGMDYRSISAQEEKYNIDYIPAFQVKTNTNLCEIHKRGRCLTASYEALRFQRISVFSVMLKQIGQYICKQQLSDALSLIQSLHINETPLDNYGLVGAQDIHSIALQLHDNGGFDLNVLLCPMKIMPKLKEYFGDLLKYENGQIYLNHIRVIPSFDSLADQIVGLDRNYAIEMVECGGVNVDYEKLIDRQFEKSAIYCCTGFSLINPKAIAIKYYR